MPAPERVNSTSNKLSSSNQSTHFQFQSGAIKRHEGKSCPSSIRPQGGEVRIDVVIVCHVEFGYATDRSVIFDKRRQGSIDGVKNAISESDKLGATISFMMMPEVLEAFGGFDFMNHQVGLHIHPDDLLLTKEGLGSEVYRPLREYDLEEQRNMISTGKQLIIDSLGVTPRTFVAGRWSIGNETLRALVELGFTHDASGCPKFLSGSCDWRKLPRICMPYRPSRDDYQMTGDLEITMVPVSKEITTGILSPENNAGFRFLRAALQEYADLSVPLVHIAFHSPAMTSPHYRKVFSQLLEWISKHGGNFCQLSKVQCVKPPIPPNAKRLSPYLMNADASALSYALLPAIKNPRKALARLRG